MCEKAYGACEGASPTWTTTPDYDSVESCVSQASNNGDTINITAGSADWSQPLTITKGIRLIGAGKTLTNITYTGSQTGTWLIMWYPTDYNYSFELSGITLNLNLSIGSVRLANYQAQYPVTGVKIHDNEFLNIGGNTGGYTSAGFEVRHPVYGVAYQNKFTGNSHMDNIGQNDVTLLNWKYGTVDYSKPEENFYYEDNIFDVSNTLATGGQGGRYLYRYNTFNINTTLSALWDAHGNSPNGTMISTTYGNKYTSATHGFSSSFALRGGKHLSFYNLYDVTAAETGGMYNEFRNEFFSFGYVKEAGPNYIRPCSSNVDGNTGTITSAGSTYIENIYAQFKLTLSSRDASIIIVEGTGKGQIRTIASGNTTTRMDVTTPFDVVPDNTSRYRICTPMTVSSSWDEGGKKLRIQSGAAAGTTGLDKSISTADPATNTLTITDTFSTIPSPGDRFEIYQTDPNLIYHQEQNDAYIFNNRFGSTLIGESIYDEKWDGSTATGGGYDWIEDTTKTSTAINMCGSTCYYMAIQLIDENGVYGESRNVNYTDPANKRIYVFPAWTTPPTAGTRYAKKSDVNNEVSNNVQFFNQQDAGFNGMAGIGCGTLVTLQNAAYYDNCTPGVGYWATNQTCNNTNLTALTGACTEAGGDRNIADFIKGTLYKCNANGNGWESYYTPYTYPHPLRSESAADTTAPAVPSGLSVQ
ncbi:MAG: hypothetical protein PHQ46_09285 [Negativicutes bacterium]|nr:hypothetical protein [Negativicutes bacterium]